MRIIIDQNGLSPESDVGQGYTQVKPLSFAPETGILGESAAVNAFTAEIVTDDDIGVGDYARLRDDLENLWAQYWITSAVRVDHRTVKITAQSDLILLDRPTMPATFYDGETVADIVAAIFDAVGYTFSGQMYTLDAGVAAVTLTGFCPEQSARERLQSVCFAAGAYIRSYFCGNLQILPISLPAGGGALIPLDRTFFKPRITMDDYVTAVTIRAYSFTQADPEDGDDYVTDVNGVTYVYTTEDITLTNPDAPGGQFPDNAVTATDVMLMDRARASAAVSLLAQVYFSRVKVELEAVNNGEYLPGQKVTVYGDADRLYTGYITACDFSFGKQARARLTIVGAEATEAGVLTIRDLFGSLALNTRRYSFPEGYAYTVPNPYIDQTRNGVRTVYRPLTEAVTGTMPQGDAEATASYAEALVLAEGIMTLISVDAIAIDAEDEEYDTGVIT